MCTCREHHWTEFGEGDEFANEMVQYLQHEMYRQQPAIPFPKDAIGFVNTAVYAIETEAHVVTKEHPFGIAFVVGTVAGAVLIATYGICRRQIYHLITTAGPTVIMSKSGKKGVSF